MFNLYCILWDVHEGKDNHILYEYVCGKHALANALLTADYSMTFNIVIELPWRKFNAEKCLRHTMTYKKPITGCF